MNAHELAMQILDYDNLSDLEVIFEIVENESTGETSRWGIDKLEIRNGLAVLKSVD